MADDVLGSLAVQITGDYSELEGSITSATSAAEAGASKIAEAFNVPMGAEMVASLGSLVDQINSVGTDGAASFGELGDAAVTASSDVEGLGTAAVTTGDSASGAASGVTELGDAASDAGTKMEGLGESLGTIAELMGVGLGIAEGINTLKELAVESVDAFGKIQMAETALTTFTGSATKSADILEQLKTLAGESIFAFPDLAAAAQKMSALGLSAEIIPDALKAIAASAEATGNGLDTVANAIDRVYLTGTLTARQLATLGISASDLGSHMTDLGLSADSSTKEVSAAFKEMGSGSTQALQILIDTIQGKVGPAFDAMKTTVPVAINQVKVAWDSMLEDFGKTAAPNLTELLGAIRSILVPIGEVATAEAALDAQQFTELVESFKGLYGAIAATAAPLVDLKKDLDGLGLSDLNASIIDSITHWKDVAYAVNLATIAWDDTSISINKAILAYDTWTGNATGAAAAAQRITDANLSLVNALLRIAEASAPATSAVNATGDAASTTSPKVSALATAHAAAAKGASDHAAANKPLVDSLAAVDQATQNITYDYVRASETWLSVKQRYLDGEASLVELGVATENADRTLKTYQKTIDDAGQSTVTATKAVSDLATVIENGKEVLVPYAGAVDGAKKSTDDLTQATSDEYQAFVNADSAASDTTDAIVQLRGSTDGAKQSTDDLSASWVYTDGVWVTSLDLIKQVNAELATQAQAATDAAAALDSEAAAWDAVNTASSGGGGKGGKGSGVTGVGLAVSGLNPFTTQGNPAGQGGTVGGSGTGAGIVEVGNAPGQGGTVGGGVGNVGLLRAATQMPTQGGGNAQPADATSYGAPRSVQAIKFADQFVQAVTDANNAIGDLVKGTGILLTSVSGVGAGAQSAAPALNTVTTAMATLGNPAIAASISSTVQAVASVVGATGQFGTFVDTLGDQLTNLGTVVTATGRIIDGAVSATTKANVTTSSAPGVSGAAAGPDPNTGIAGSPMYTLVSGKWTQTGTWAGFNNYTPPSAPLNPGTGGFGLTAAPGNPTNLTISFAGATIYGQQGADMVANALTNALRTNAGLKLF